MSDFRAAAHLAEQLGDERFQALISSDNTGKVKDFCDELILASLPTTMTVGGRTYDLLGFLRKNEESVRGPVMVERAKEMNANLGKEECAHLLGHQGDIPFALRGKVVFVFTDLRRPGFPKSVACVYWIGGCWVQCWDWLGIVWNGNVRILRRK